ncbi:hypothetical protein [Marinobacter sp. CA1]|uniref:hypothetical protein n=1 Tax=Marinobacter sp. CA1 TaxID=2817656 RepID=UPI001D06A199|nr:hypothetical protein [Marinobacter sp. CA1]UDL07062.1 hypothetical protein J2887_10060 [Marinobacter sp. CA1]
MNIIHRIRFTLLILFSLPVIGLAQSLNVDSLNYENVYRSDQLSIDLAHSGDEQFVRTYLETVVPNSKVSQIKDLIFNLDGMPNWLGGVINAELIVKINESSQVATLVNGMPFPLNDRYIVMIQELVHESPDEVRIRLTSDYSFLEDSMELVRVDPYNGQWTIKQHGNDVKVELSDVWNGKTAGLPEFAVVNHIKSVCLDTINQMSELEFK